MRPRPALIAAAIALTLSSPALAKPDKGWGPPPHAKAAKADVADVKVKHVDVKKAKKAKPHFSDDDAAHLRVYFMTQPVAWTALPPGIAMNVARGKRLPPGIAKKLPQDALANLPRHEGYEYAQVGRDIVLIEAATRLVVDIIERIFD
jgi:hypothetical protein